VNNKNNNNYYYYYNYNNEYNNNRNITEKLLWFNGYRFIHQLWRI